MQNLKPIPTQFASPEEKRRLSFIPKDRSEVESRKNTAFSKTSKVASKKFKKSKILSY